MGLHEPGGYRFDEEDHDWLRDNQLPAETVEKLMSATFARPESIDPRPFSYMDPTGQTSEGSCQGWAISDCGSFSYYCKTQQWKRFSPDAAYYLTQQIDGIRGDQGSTISGGMRVASQIGFLPWEDMPYTPRYNPQDVPADYAAKSEKYKLYEYALVKRDDPNPYKSVVEWLGRGLGCPSWGISWGVSLDSEGFMQWRPGGGGHANSIQGYGGPLDSDGLPEYLWDKNSWGLWGPLKGWCKVKRSTFEKIVQHPHTVIALVSDMRAIEIKPRKVNFVTNSVIR